MFNFLFNFQRGLARGSVVGAPEISITSGSGYAGSTYTSTDAGQWTADGVDISGVTGTSYVMTLANEGKAIRCDGSNTIQMVTPANISSSPALDFWDAARGVTIATGVSVWAGVRGVLSASQATASAQPAFVAGTGSSYPKLLGDGVDDRLQITPRELLPLGADPSWIMVVGKVLASTANQTIVGWGDANINRARRVMYRTSDVAYDHDGGESLLVSAPTNTFSLIAREPTSAALGPNIVLNGVTTVGSDGTTPDTLIADAYLFARGKFANYNANAEVLMIAIGAGHLSDADAARLEGWAAWKMAGYGHLAVLNALPVGHPYKTTAPRIS